MIKKISTVVAIILVIVIATFSLAATFSPVGRAHPASLGGRVSGSIVYDDVATIPMPLEGALVTVGNRVVIRATTTDSLGHYSFANLRTGRYKVSFSKDGYETVTRTVRLKKGSNTINVILKCYREEGEFGRR